MRLKQINIINFGQFSNKSFDLPSKEINVFFGANEAGKSTTVAFIKQIMFGFHLRSNSSPFFEDYTPLAHVSPMGGSLVFEAEDGEYELERLYAKGDKTKRGILTVKKDGQVVPESLFFDQIQNIDGSFYADSFIFNQEMLGQVSSLSQEDLLERIYYLGAADSGKLLEMRDDFAKEAGKLFKKTGKKPEVNRLLTQMENDRGELAQTQAEFNDYKELDRDLSAKNDELKTKQQALEKLQKRAQELRDLQKELGNYQTLLDLQKRVKDTSFDSENYQKAQDIMAQGRNLQKTIKSLEDQLADLDKDDQTNLAANKKIVQQKPQLLQWQAEYRVCMQKADELEQEKDQILTLSPDTRKVLDLTPDQLRQLQADYLALPKQENRNEAVSNNSNDKIWYIVGTLLTAIGLLFLVMVGTAGVIAAITGLIFLAIGYVKGNNANKQNAAILEKQKLVAQKRQDFQKQYGLNPDTLDVNNLLSNANQYHLKESAEKANNEQLNQINQEVSQLATSVQNALKKPIENDFGSVLNGIDELDEKIDQSQEIGQRRLTLSSSLKQDKQDLKELGLKLQTLFAQAGVQNMADYDALYQDSLEQAKIKTQIEALKKSLNDDLTELADSKPDELEQKLHELNEQISSANDEINDLQQQVAQVQVKLNNMADSTAVFEAKQELANAETNFANSSKEYLANLLASKWISRSLDLASNERFPKMLKAAKEYLALLTGGRYVDIDLGKKLTVVRKDGKKRDVKYLSRGTAEQLYFALKLAFVEQIKDEINLPILIDDSFVNFDDKRIKYIEQLLKKISENNQVLIFTAQENLVEKLGIQPLTFTKGQENA
ncbi:AAA family ATPase [uncultured Lactobacillus sp.]|uniref:ATP-binding protein n=1 Tax=uncultured Lactobacillus sp. TaxID=153152 RepID=UPI002805F5D1|nr:AAA family ATPase [uncultured Lactobacillus sp.]